MEVHNRASVGPYSPPHLQQSPLSWGSLLVLPLALLQVKAGTGRDVTTRRAGAGMLGLPVFLANPVFADIG